MDALTQSTTLPPADGSGGPCAPGLVDAIVIPVAEGHGENLEAVIATAAYLQYRSVERTAKALGVSVHTVTKALKLFRYKLNQAIPAVNPFKIELAPVAPPPVKPRKKYKTATFTPEIAEQIRLAKERKAKQAA